MLYNAQHDRGERAELYTGTRNTLSEEDGELNQNQEVQYIAMERPESKYDQASFAGAL